MTRLADLHKRLARLQRRRRRVRWETAYSALLLALLWVLAAAFLVDWYFEMNRPQRLILLVICVGAVIWAFRRFTLPWLGQKETELDMALLVEREERIDSDLVAAVQFESPEAPEWGSVQLEQAVIEGVAVKGRRINVMRGLSRQELSRRSKLLLITVIVWGLVVIFLSGHVTVFFNRLLLGSLHYPTRTRIESMTISGHNIEDPIYPEPLTLRYGEPLKFEIRCSGDFPEKGTAKLAAKRSGLRTALTLSPLWSGTSTVQAGDDVLADPAKDFSKLDPKTVKNITIRGEKNAGTYNLVEVIDERQIRVQPEFNSDGETDYLIRVQSEGEEEIRDYIAELPRLVDSVQYRIFVGDAWTEPGHLGVGELPNIELELVVEPPRYAKTDPKAGPLTMPRGLRQISVIEGSRVQVNIYSDKLLEDAAVTIAEKDADGTILKKAHAMKCVDADAVPQQWFLDPKDTPLSAVTEPIRYSLQVTDTDGLQLEQPIEGTVRIQADSPPRIAAAAVTLFVLPVARPTIYYQAVDDYGVARIVMDRKVIHADGELTESQSSIYVPPAGKPPATNIEQSYVFDLASLKMENGDPLELKKGDQVEVVLRAVDFRGPREGKTASAETLVFEVTDDVGILEHLTEADRRSVRQLKTMIQRQLGIGESP